MKKEVSTKNKIIAIKKGSTLVLSNGDNIQEVTLEHDAFAKIDYTNSIIVSGAKNIYPEKPKKSKLELLT